jgi:DNA-binding MarR family transcriptional regulator
MTMARAPAALLESTGYLLARVGSESRRSFVEALARHKVSLGAFSVLMILGDLSDSTQRRLADAVGIDPRNLVPILDDLEVRGLVARGANPADRRRHAVRLTQAGRTQLTRLAVAGAAAEMELLRPLSKVERRQLHSLLARLLPDLSEN